MSLLPVLDLMHGQIVRGIAGKRDAYRPIVSQLVDSDEPVAVARAMRTHFGFVEFYLADLDAIRNGQPALAVYNHLHQEPFQLWIDAGIRSAKDATLSTLLAESTSGIIVGLESVDGPAELTRIVQRAGGERTVFSLDLQEGQPLGRTNPWPSTDPWGIAATAINDCGVQRLIVLDLARVGIGAGVGTAELCMRLKRTYPQVQITTGGGVRGIADVRRLEEIGVDYVLVASALHDGRITSAELNR